MQWSPVIRGAVCRTDSHCGNDSLKRTSRFACELDDFLCPIWKLRENNTGRKHSAVQVNVRAVLKRPGATPNVFALMQSVLSSESDLSGAMHRCLSHFSKARRITQRD